MFAVILELGIERMAETKWRISAQRIDHINRLTENLIDISTDGLIEIWWEHRGGID